ncbi:MAG: hypothetical protein J0H02_15865 [Armatimonadetes bacterium]|nr:hypothetical protein [Armatimonadota bacterium]
MPLLVALALLAFPPQTSYRDKIGVGLEGIGSRGLEFVDVMKTTRPLEKPSGGPAKIDANGWPLEDFKLVAFDMRPVMAWAPPMDDPEGYQMDVSGSYSLSFKGKADLTIAGDSPDFKIANKKYDPAQNLTTADLICPKGKALMVVTFQNTGGAVKDIHLLRPGYSRASKQVFTTPFLKAIQPFPVLRFMDWLDSNGTNPFYGDAKNTTEWSDRHLPTDATYTRQGRKFGVPWETIIALANEAKKDVWINIPVAASDDYIKNLAALMKRDLNPQSAIYLEYNNEVWNWGFLQSTYNRMAAEAEVKAGNSNLNNDGEKNWDVWRRRRHARRSLEIGQIFLNAFGKDSFGKRIRPVMAWWVIAPDQYKDMLEWVKRTYGAPNKYFVAIAGAPYFNTHEAPKTASPDQLLATLRRATDAWVPGRKTLIDLAKSYGLKCYAYEGGPDSGGGDPTNVANRIRAHRDPRMKELVYRDLKTNWFDLGGDLFMYFTLTSASSRYGMWGLSEDITQTNTPKWQAIHQLMGK